MNVFLVDDHGMMREALRGFLSAMGERLGQDLAFFEANSVPEALAFPEVPDLVLLDMQLKQGPSGTEALAALRSRLPDTKVIVVSGIDDADFILKCIDLGAVGYVPKLYKSDVLKAAITIILQGVPYVPPHILEATLPSAREPAPVPPAGPHTVASHPALAHLTPRQREALELLMCGRSNKTIARELGIAFGTVKLHLQNLYRALGVTGRVEAICLASRLGVAAPGSARVPARLA
jgi:DNA-binding NarL/FixJ family response regulator